MENTGITYKLNRFFNVIFNPTMNKWLILANIVMIIWNILSNKGSIVVDIACILIVNGMMILDMLFHSPKKIISNGEVIEFAGYIIKRKKFRFGIKKGEIIWNKVSYSVLDIKEIQFHQNFIEKMFDIGHISFCGRAVWMAISGDDGIKKKDRFEIYGIKRFSDFKARFSV